MSLYRKYRPQKFSEIVGQSFTVRTLTNAVQNRRIGHAYLFTGPRGTGKTTLARLFAKTVNCLEPSDLKKPAGENFAPALEPCNRCENCQLILDNRALDLIEIDAASHTGVDNIRSLKETVVLPPSQLKYKIYIIDEVHMLSLGAFNALLKTLEEPPAHAIFILATTELHKVPETIISRCQRFDIAPLTNTQIVERLKIIAKKEKVKIDQESLELIALAADGGMRDAESILSQITAWENQAIKKEDVRQLLGTASKQATFNFIHSLSEGKIDQTLSQLDQLQKEGINLKVFATSLLEYLRNLLIIKTVPKGNEKLIRNLTQEQLKKATETADCLTINQIVSLTEAFQTALTKLKDSPLPGLPLELVVIEFGNSDRVQPEKIVLMKKKTTEQKPLEKTEKEPVPQEPIIEEKKENPQNTERSPKAEDQKPQKEKSEEKNVLPLKNILDSWADILEAVKPENHSIHAFLKNCIPCGLRGEKLFIKTKYDFYQEKLSASENRLTVQTVIARIVGASLRVVFITEKEAENQQFEKEKEGHRNVLHDAMQMMGGRIVKS